MTIYWAEGSRDFGYMLLQTAVQSLNRLEKNAGLKVTDPIQIIIYPTAEEMRQSLLTNNQWAGGVAFPEYRIVLIGIPIDSGSWAQEVIPHELAHLVTDMRVFNCRGGSLPTWLDEGISQYAGGPVTNASSANIAMALQRDKLPALNTLANGFPANSELANQAYDQSWMVVSYLIDTYGPQKLDLLLDEVHAGNSIDNALKTVYEVDTNGLDQTWRSSLGFGDIPVPGSQQTTPTVTRTTVPTLALHVPAGKATATSTSTPTASATPVPTLQPSVTSTPPAPTATAETTSVSAEQTSRMLNPFWIIVGGIAGLFLLGIAATGIMIWVLRKKA